MNETYRTSAPPECTVAGSPLPARPHHQASPDVSAYAHAYHNVFFWTVPLTAIALVLALLMREKPLSEEMLQVVEGKTEAPEY